MGVWNPCTPYKGDSSFITIYKKFMYVVHQVPDVAYIMSEAYIWWCLPCISIPTAGWAPQETQEWIVHAYESWHDNLHWALKSSILCQPHSITALRWTTCTKYSTLTSETAHCEKPCDYDKTEDIWNFSNLSPSDLLPITGISKFKMNPYIVLLCPDHETSKSITSIITTMGWPPFLKNVGQFATWVT